LRELRSVHLDIQNTSIFMSSVATRGDRLLLNALSAADLMTAEPITISASAFVNEAIAMMVDHGVSALPVVDEHGKPVGVVSHTDIVVHDRNRHDNAVPEYYTTTNLLSGGSRLLARFSLDPDEVTRVHSIMTPTVFAVRPGDPVARVVGDMVAFKLHRLFVTRSDGTLLGVVSAFDVLRKLRAE
jgi:CBS domain-containing protein